MATRKKKFIVRYSAELADFICSKVEKGMTLTDICRKYKSKMPESKTVYQWRRTRPDFKEKYDTAYQTKLYGHLDEIMDLMDAPLPTPDEVREKYGIEGDDVKSLKTYLYAEQQNRRLKIDSLKFITSKIMPKMVPEMSDKIKVDHEVKGMTFVLQDWSTPKVEKIAKGVEISVDKAEKS